MSSTLKYDPAAGLIDGRSPTQRYLRDLRDSFADAAAVDALLRADDNPLLYYVTQIEDAMGEGDLHYGLGVLLPGKVGVEYFMTRGHLHAWRAAAEVYLGLRGRGLMLLENEQTGACEAVALEANTIVHVPGHTAHRTINTGAEPLVYWGILSSRAGHDYGAVGKRNFSKVVVEVDGAPVVMDRTEYPASHSPRTL